jgi:hypothetical protein
MLERAKDGGFMMSKRKKKMTSAEKAMKAREVIADSRRPTLMVKDLPGWLQGIALNRFKWIQWIAFIPLVLAVLATPMLQNQVPSALSSSAGMVNKNILFIVPFGCLIAAYGCWISIKTRRRADRVSDDIKRFAVMEIETFIGNVLVIAICIIATLWQIFVAFH